MLSHFKVPTYNNAYATSEINEQTTHAHLQTSVDLPDGQIDYFAGCRDDVFFARLFNCRTCKDAKTEIESETFASSSRCY